MDEHHYFSHKAGQQGPTRPQYNIPQPQFMHALRSVAPRERYRVAQHDHPMYDMVEDHEFEQGALLESFDERMLQQPYDYQQHQAVRGRARLSQAPASSRYFGSRVIEQERSQQQMQHVYKETYDDKDWGVYSDNAINGPLGRSAYNINPALDSSSDVSLGVSSPALKANRRRAGEYEINATQQGSQLQPFRHLPPHLVNDHDDDSRRSYPDHESFSKLHKNGIDRPFQQNNSINPKSRPMELLRALPTVQGIPLVPISALPDRLRTVFPFPTFNAVQSKCFDRVFRSDNNFVLASPTGSGKTAILELAVCRAVASNTTGQYKIVYQAPTKALCSERQRDWDKKFTQIGLKCTELTGDSDASDLRNVQSANIIITTPEKWDSITRKWKDHEKLMKLIKLFLIDEVHILKEDRGAVLEVVVSRMKSIGTDVRFVALSATVPNFHDVACWLGKNSVEKYVPAPNEKFGEEFRPVKLRKHVCGYVCNNNNDFAFEKQLDTKLTEVITKYSERKPMMVFCATRNSTINTARLIANWWSSKNGHDRLWTPPTQVLRLQNKDLSNFVASGVAFHHAGLDFDDRARVEKGFLQGDISVICCTSTLAVGVNLPCHLVIIKNTVSWAQDGLQEYSDLEMMQMLGRAGRPQFDDSAVAVIMTRQTKVRRYETLVTGEEILESKLHLNLINHMNAEIGLGTIRDLESARKWLTGTFLHVRLQQNPIHYQLEGSKSGQVIQEQVDDICFRDITLLRQRNLVTGEDYFRCTEYGYAMARYYVHFETMEVFMGLQPKSTLSEILSAIAQAAEFSKIRFRQGEKGFYKMLNKSPSIRYPIPVNVDLPAHKVSLIVQSILGSADISWDGDMGRHRSQYRQEESIIFKSINSLIRCIIDCQIFSGDSVGIHSALMLERSLGSRAWDDSPLQMIQIPNIGTVAVRKLVNAGIRGIEELEGTDARRIETIVGRNPPFGLKILDALRSFPKLRVSLHAQPSSVIRTPQGVKIQVNADIGFMNERPPDRFGNRIIYVCMLAETSDGRKIHFARINGSRLGAGQSLVFSALLTSSDQKINCYLMCEGIAGSMRGATLIPKIAASLFPDQAPKTANSAPTHQPNMSRRRIENASVQRKKSVASDDFGDADIDDDALVEATYGDLDFQDIDNFASPADVTTRSDTVKHQSAKEKVRAEAPAAATEGDDGAVPVQLSNGRWACSHKCKDKEACKHYCCKHGMDKPPKKAAPKRVSTDEKLDQLAPPKTPVQQENKTQIKPQLQTIKRRTPSVIEELDLTQIEKKQKTKYATTGPRDYRDLHDLHKNTQKNNIPSSLHAFMHKKPAYCYGEGDEYQLSFLSQPTPADPKMSSEYDSLHFDHPAIEPSVDQYKLTNSEEMALMHSPDKISDISRRSDTFGDDDSIFGEAMIGLADSHDPRRANNTGASSMQDRDALAAVKAANEFLDLKFPVAMDFSVDNNVGSDLSKQPSVVSAPQHHQVKQREARVPVFQRTSSPIQRSKDSQPADSMLQDQEVQQSHHGETDAQPPRLAAKDEMGREDIMSDPLSLLDGLPAETTEKTISSHSVIANESWAESGRVKEEGPNQIPEAFEDLQPWLFQEFGDIVELVDE